MYKLKPKQLSSETIMILEEMILNGWKLPDSSEAFTKEIQNMISTSESPEQISFLTELVNVDFSVIQLHVNEILQYMKPNMKEV